MRISFKHRLIYLSNPKTGSTAVRRFFDNSGLTDKGYDPKMDYYTAKEAKQFIESLGLKWNDFYIFTTVRNPYDRLVAIYYYSKPDISFNPFYISEYDKKTQFYYDFHTYSNAGLSVVKSLESQGIDSRKTLFLPGYVPLKKFAFDGETLLVNKIIPCEQLVEQLQQILNHKGIQIQINLEKVNRSKHGVWTDYFDSKRDRELINSINNYMSSDFIVGNYKKM